MLAPIIAILLLVWLLARSNVLSRLGPDLMPRLTERATSILIVGAALFVLLRGNIYLALLMFGVSLWFLGRSTRPFAGLRQRGQSSEVRSKRIEMALDRSSGVMAGRVIEGRDAGALLDDLDRYRLELIYAACRQDDPDGARLLEAYFDRRFPGWRAAGDGHGDAGAQKARSSGRLSEEEAYQVLGLSRGATRDDVVRAHRTLMKKWHPDQGGSATLAARANEAKEVLLRREF